MCSTFHKAKQTLHIDPEKCAFTVTLTQGRNSDGCVNNLFTFEFSFTFLDAMSLSCIGDHDFPRFPLSFT